MSRQQSLEPLVADALRGSQAAFGELYRLLAPAVLGYLRAQGTDEPEDLCSEVFIGVFRNLKTFSGGGVQFRSWVFSVAHHRIVDDRRRRARRPADVALDDSTIARPLPAEADAGADAATAAAARMGTARVVEICSMLAPDQRDVLLLRLVCDLTVDQVAELLEKSPGAVKALQRRALGSVARNFSDQAVPL